MLTKKKSASILLTAAAGLLFTACGAGPAGSATPSAGEITSAATATAAPPRRLTVCMGEEPKTLYLYGGGGLATRTVLETVYDGPMDALNFSYTPVILADVPSLANGGAELRAVTVQAGDTIIADNGTRTALVAGVRYRPAGCTDDACVAAYAEGPVQMDQLVVTFQLKEGLVWSDGQPLTADDSLYSYELASSTGTSAPVGLKRALEGTSQYETLDATTARWTGLPGNMDPGYAQRFWTPLPRHAWGAIPAAQLFTADDSARRPLGWGPYIIESWEAGKSIELRRNPNYSLGDGGLPKFDLLTIRFVNASGDLGLSALLSGECDMLDQTVRLDEQIPMLLDLQKRGLLEAAFVTGTSWEHVDFNLKPASGYGKAYVQDVRLRQAVAQCLNRQKIVDDVLSGLSAVPDTYLPPQHPLYATDARKYPYNPVGGKALLDEIGWKDTDGNANTPRVAAGVAGVTDGTELRLRYDMVQTVLRQNVLTAMAEGLESCQIGMEIMLGDNTLFVPSQDGRIFGLRYDLAEFGWISGIEPPCELYSSSEIPSAANGWLGMNVTGFSNPDFDRACSLARRSLPGTPAYVDNQKLAQRIFADYLPSIPLFLTVKAVAARPGFEGLILDATAGSALWNIENFDYPDL